jgi:hypothetical protein
LTEEQREAIERIVAAFYRLRELSLKFRRNGVWQALYDLCVLNQAIGPIQLRDVKLLLEWLGPQLTGERRIITPFARLGPILRGTEEDYKQHPPVPKQSDAHLAALDGVRLKVIEDPDVELGDL